MPLMSDWMNDLTQRLNATGRGALAQAVGLSSKGSGEEFEASLGRLLAWQRALPTVASLSRLGSPTHERSPEFEEWAFRATEAAQGLVTLIYESLHELFGRNQINQNAASAAYRTLIDLFKLPSDGTIVFATTNYDVAIELALQDLSVVPLAGTIPRIGTDGVVRPEGVTGQAKHDAFPVLHLHGRVGWYRDDSGSVRDAGADGPFNPTLGPPGLLLPDPDKDYSDQRVLSDMWTEMTNVIAEAKKILIVGHSLHDKALADSLRSATATRTVAYLQYRPREGTMRSQVEVQREQQFVVDALGASPQWHEAEFGPQWSPDGNLRAWSDQVAW
jgi:hypothetical protein